MRTAAVPDAGQVGRTMSAVHAETTVATRDAMHDLGRRMAALLRAGDLVVLTGDLGSGKTTLTQGIGDGLGVRGPVTSPTFVIARVHPSEVQGPPLVHVDAYRLGSIAEVDDLDLDASLDECVTVVEWGQGLVDELAPDRLEVSITRPRGAEPALAAGPGGRAGEPDDGDPEDGDPDGPGDVEEPRAVVLDGVGERWADVRWEQ